MPTNAGQVTHKESVQRISEAAVRDRIVALTISGLTQEQIAAQVGLDRSSVSRHLNAALQEATERRKINTEHLVQLELETLNLAQRSIMPQVLKGNIKANAQLLRILESRAKYLGLYAPIRIAIKTIMNIVTLLNYLQLSPDDFFEVIYMDLLQRANVVVLNGVVLPAAALTANDNPELALLNSGLAPTDSAAPLNAESLHDASSESVSDNE